MTEELKDGKLTKFTVASGEFEAEILEDNGTPYVFIDCISEFDVEHVEQIAVRLLALVDTIKSNQPIEVQP